MYGGGARTDNENGEVRGLSAKQTVIQDVVYAASHARRSEIAGGKDRGVVD